MLDGTVGADRDTRRDLFPVAWLILVVLFFTCGAFAAFRFNIGETYGLPERIDTESALGLVANSLALPAAMSGLAVICFIDAWLTSALGGRGRWISAAGIVFVATLYAVIFSIVTMAAFWASGVGTDATPEWQAVNDVWTGYTADLILIFILLQFLHALSRKTFVTIALFVLYVIAVLLSATCVDTRFVGFGSTSELVLTLAEGRALGLEGAWYFRLYWALVALVLLCLQVGLDDRERSIVSFIRSQKFDIAKTKTPFILAFIVISTISLVSAKLHRWSSDIDITYAEQSSPPLRSHDDARPTALYAQVSLDVRPSAAGVTGRLSVRNDTPSLISHLIFEKAPVLRLTRAIIASDDRAHLTLTSRFLSIQLSRPMRPGTTISLEYSGQIAPINPLDTLASTVVGNETFYLTTAMFLPLPWERGCLSPASVCSGDNYQMTDAVAGRLMLRQVEGLHIASAGFVGINPSGHLWAADIMPSAIGHLLLAGAHFKVAMRRENSLGGTTTAFVAPYSTVNPALVANYASKEFLVYSRRWARLESSDINVVQTPTALGLTLAYKGGVAIGERYLRSGSRTDGLSKGSRLVLSHELAHQWWGYEVMPQHAPGAPFVIESFAQAAALARLQEQGELTEKEVGHLLHPSEAGLTASTAHSSLRLITLSDARAYYEGPAAILATGTASEVLDTLGRTERGPWRRGPALTPPSEIVSRLICETPKSARPALEAALR